MQVPTETEVRTLRNYVGGAWIEPSAERTIEDRDPASGERRRTRAALRRRRTSTPRSGRRARPSRPGEMCRRRSGARAVFALRDALIEHREELAALVTADMGKTLDDARRRGAARDRVGRGRGCDPPPAQGREPRGRGRRGRRRACAPARRRGRRDHAVQLPGDDPALVPALRDRLRQHVRPQALGARPAAGGADLRADRLDRAHPAGCRQPRARRRARRSTAILDHPGIDAVSLRRPGDYRPERRRGRGRDRQASRRRSAAPRTPSS